LEIEGEMIAGGKRGEDKENKEGGEYPSLTQE